MRFTTTTRQKARELTQQTPDGEPRSRTLVTQMTVRYAVVAIALLLLVGCASTFVSFVFYVRLTSEAVASVAHLASGLDLRGLDRPAAMKRAQAAADQLSRPPLVIRIIDASNHRLGGTEAPSAVDEPIVSNGLYNAMAAVFGLHPQRVKLPGGTGTVLIAPDESKLRARVSAYWLAILPVGALAVALAIILGRSVAVSAVRPMLDVTKSLTALGAGDFTPRRIAASSTTEVSRLTEAYDQAVRQVGAAFAERRETELHIRQFIADAGHELRTPLTIMMGYVDLLEGGVVQDSGMRTRVYENIRSEGRRMRRLVDRLILLARLERPGPESRPAPLDIAALVAQLAAAQSGLPDTKQRLHVELPPLPPSTLLVHADPTEMREAIENLLDNALKYAPRSDVFLRVAADQTFVTIAVEDYGPGIEADEQDRIFDRFYRGRANDGDVEGSGLGLAIVKRAIERAHGTLEVESRVAIGSRFTIRLNRVSNGTA